MAKQKHISPSDVLEILQRDGKTTRAAIARELGCSIGTVSGKVGKLVKDGENIGFDQHGLFLQDKEDIINPRSATITKKWTDRIINSLMMWAHRGNNHRPIAIAARKQIASGLTSQERNQLKSNLLLIARVIDAVALDEELGS